MSDGTVSSGATQLTRSRRSSWRDRLRPPLLLRGLHIFLTLALTFFSLVPSVSVAAASARSDGPFRGPGSVGGASGLAVPTGDAPITLQAGESVTLAPHAGPAGTITSATGVGFTAQAGQVLHLTWDGAVTIVGMAMPAASGGFVATFPIPDSATPGAHSITVGGVTTPFTVAPFVSGPLPGGSPLMGITPDAGPSGQSVTANGTGLGATQSLQVWWASPLQQLTAGGAATTAADGSFGGTTFSVPAGLAMNGYAVTAIGGSSGRSATARYTRGVAIDVVPQTIGTTVGQMSSTVTVRVRSGSQPLDGAEVHFGFNPSVLEVVDAVPDVAGVPSTLGVQLTPGTTFGQNLLSSADNTLGTIDIGQGRGTGQGAPSGSVVLATFQVRGKAVGSSTFTRGFAETGTGGIAYDTVTTLPTVVVGQSAISVSPTQGPGGSSAVISGSFFDPSAPVTLTWDSPVTSLATVTTGADGAFSSANISIPSGAAAGNHNITATQGAKSATAMFNVVTPALSLTPDRGPAGGSVTVTGTNFAANQAVTVRFNGVTVVTAPPSISADGAGGFTASTSVPAGTADGVYAVSASQLVGAVSASANFTVAPESFIKLSGDNPIQTAPVTAQLGNPFVVEARDAANNPIVGRPVTFAVATMPAGATGQVLMVTNTNTNASGQAATTLTLGTKSGSYTVTATATGFAPLTFTATATPGDATTIALTSGDNQTAMVTTALANPFIVTTTDAHGNAKPGVGVTFAIATFPPEATGQTLFAPAPTTGENGQAAATLTFGTRQGAYTVTATATGLTGSPITFTATATAGPPVAMALTRGNNQTGTVTTTLTNPFVVTVTDAGGNVKAGVDVTFAIATFPVGATGQTLSATTSTTNANGEASSTLTLGNQPGPYTVTASANGLTGSPVTFTAATEVGPAAVITIISGNGQSGQVTLDLAAPFIVKVTDIGGIAKPDAGVTFALATMPAGTTGQLLTQTSAITDASGVASSTLKLGTKAGSYTVEATCPACSTTLAVTFTATGTAGPATTITMTSGDGQSGPVTVGLANPFVVTVTDAHNNPVPSVPVAFALATMPAGATGQQLSAANPTTNASGEASTALTLGAKSGTYTVTATANGVAGSPATFTATATPGAAAALSFTAEPGGGSANGIWPQQPAVTVFDAHGNVATNATTTVTLAITAGTGAAGAVLTCDQTSNQLAVSAGIATFTGCRINLAGGGYSLRATSPTGGLSTVTSALFNINSGPAVNLLRTSGNDQTGVVTSTLAAPFIVTVTDDQGNPASGTAITFAIATFPTGATGQSLITINATTDVNGQANATLMLGTRPGVYTVTAAGNRPASGPLLGSPVTFTATAVAGDPASITLISGNNQSGAVTTALTSPFIVTVTDAGGNVKDGTVVDFAIASAPAGALGQRLSRPSAPTDANGQAAVTLTLGTKVGNYLVTASFAGLTGAPVVFTAAATAGPAATIARASGHSQSALPDTILSNPLVVLVTDANANPVAGTAITWAIGATPLGGGNAQVIPAGAATDEAGQASARLTMGATPGDYTVTTSAAGLAGSPVTFAASARQLTPVAVVKVGGDGQAGLVNAPLPRQLVVAVRDAQERAVPNVAVVFSFTGLPQPTATGQLLTPAGGVTNSQGLLSTTLTLGDVTGTYQITATCDACTTKTALLTATAVGNNRLVKVSGDEQIGMTNGELPRPLVVAVLDQTGRPVRGVNVTFAPSQGTPAGTTPITTDDNGRAAFSLTLGAAGNTTVQAVCTVSCGSATDDLVFSATARTRHTLRGSVTGVDILGQPLTPPGDASHPEYPAVQGARVTLSQADYGLSVSATTDATGAFALDMIEGEGSLAIAAPDFAAIPARRAMMDAGGSQSPSQAALVIRAVKPGQTITGTVLDPDGNPLVGAAVTAIEVDPATASNPRIAAGAGTLQASTGAGGVYSLAVPVTTFWKITGTWADLGSANVDLDTNGVADIVSAGAVGQTVRFRPTLNLQGTVQVDGATPASANVSAVPVGGPPSAGNITTTNGAFTLRLQRPGVGVTFTYIVNVLVPDVGELIPRQITVNSAGRCLDAAGAIIDCTALVFSAYTSMLTVSFVNPSGNPVNVAGLVNAVGTTVVGAQTINGPMNSVSISNASSARVRVVSGEPALGVTSKQYNVRVSVAGFGELFNGPVSVPGDRSLTVSVPVPFTISGRVTANGVNIEGALVQAVSATGSTRTLSAADGTYTLNVPGVRAQYQLTATKPDFIAATLALITLDGSLSGQNLFLLPVSGQNTISGVVNGPTADVLVRVTATSTDGRTISITRGTPGPNCPSVALTAFCMSVGQGTWTVRATADGFAFATIAPASAANTASGPVAGLTITMTAVATLEAQSQQCGDTTGCRAEAQGSRIIVIFPPNAAGNDGATHTLTIKETTDAPETAGFKTTLTTAGGQPIAIDFTLTSSNGTAVTQFSAPVTIRIEGATAGTVVGFFDETTGDWTPLTNCTSDATGVTCTTTHFTKFTVLSSKVAPAAPPVVVVPPGGGGGGGGGGSSPTPTPTPVVGGVTPNGGVFGSGGLTVAVPAGATTVNLQGQITVATSLPVDTAAPAVGALTRTILQITLRDGSGQLVTSLSKPATLTLPFSQADRDFVGDDAAQLRLVRYDEATRGWVNAGTVEVGANGQSLVVTVDHFSLFALVVEPSTPALAGPANMPNVTGLDPVLAWNNPGGTRQYQLQVTPHNNDGPAINLIIGAPDLVAAARYQVLPPVFGTGNYTILPGMNYTWRVRTTPLGTPMGENDPGWSEWSTQHSFRTGAPASTTIEPVSQSGGGPVDTLTPRLEWRNTNPRIFYYEVQLSTDAAFETDPARATAAVYWNLIHGGVTSPLNSWTAPASAMLEAGATYFWRVRPRVQGDGTPTGWSDTWSFRTP